MNYKDEYYIERATHYEMEAGKLSYYETNCFCEDVIFQFDSYVITMMLDGHKTVISDNRHVEFYPGLVYVPEKDCIFRVSMRYASKENPTRALILKIDNHFLESYISYLTNRPFHQHKPIKSEKQSAKDFLTQNTHIIDCLKKLYRLNQFSQDALIDEINSLIIKEIILHLYHSDCLPLLLNNCHQTIEDKSIRKAITFIEQNIQKPIATSDLMKVSCLGKTTFFNKFSEATGLSPIAYINEKRISLAKTLLYKKHRLSDVAFECGFTSYQNFAKVFKKLEGINPKTYAKEVKMENSTV